jgi:adenosylcobinamide-GDP ribazoletransferase
MRNLREALRFLTILPMPGKPAESESSIAAAIPWFPVAGLIIGALLLLPGWLVGEVWGGGVRAALIVVAWAALTAGLHLDGLSDTFDAVLSWRTRERKLEIMKDSRIGAMGAIALVAVLLLKFAWLHEAGEEWWRGVLLAPLWGRWADIYGIYWFPSAREGGMGRTFQAHVKRRDFVAATAAALMLAALFGQWRGVLSGVLVWGCSHLLARWWTRDLGGLTGDTYGALNEIGEVVALAILTL